MKDWRVRKRQREHSGCSNWKASPLHGITQQPAKLPLLNCWHLAENKERKDLFICPRPSLAMSLVCLLASAPLQKCTFLTTLQLSTQRKNFYSVEGKTPLSSSEDSRRWKNLPKKQTLLLNGNIHFCGGRQMFGFWIVPTRDLLLLQPVRPQPCSMSTPLLPKTPTRHPHAPPPGPPHNTRLTITPRLAVICKSASKISSQDKAAWSIISWCFWDWWRSS